MATGTSVAQDVVRRGGVAAWLRNIAGAVATVADALWVTVRYWVRTYDPQRRTFTEQLPVSGVAAGGRPSLPRLPPLRPHVLHRLRSLRRDCPVNCIYIGKERVEGARGFT